MPNKILIVDDEPFNLDLLEQELMDYDYVIEKAADGVEALEKIDSFDPDVILLDYMMPRMNGLEVVRRLRENERHKSIPVILLTAKATQEDKIAGLNAGADDYVTKPFDSFELLARVRAMLRRVQKPARQLKTLGLGEVRIDFAQQKAWRGRKPLHLTTKEFSMLRLLAEARGEPVSRERFLDIVWGYTAFPTTRTVDNHVASLRSKIEKNPDDPRWIQTVHGVGYRLELPEFAKP